MGGEGEQSPIVPTHSSRQSVSDPSQIKFEKRFREDETQESPDP